MQAIQPVTPPVRPEKKTRRPLRRKTQTQPHQAIAVETTAKLAANLILSVCTTSALVQLLPHHYSVQAKLQEIQAEVKVTESRVNKVRTEFNRNFDPSQAQSIMQEQSNRVDPQQRQIIWLEPDSPDAEAPAPQP